MKDVRFLNNFILTTVSTSLDDDGQLVAKESIYHISSGSTYSIDDYQINGNTVSIFFPATGPITGIAPQVEPGYCEFRDTQNVVAPKAGGCGCGGAR